MEEFVVGSGLIILFPIATLLAGIALEGLLAGILSARAKGWLAFISSLAALAGVAAAWPAIFCGRIWDVSLGRWDGPIQLVYHVDGLSLLFALMAAAIGAAVLLYSVGYMEEEKGTTRFYALVLLFIAGLIHLVYTADLFLLYLSWEVVGLCSFLLVGFWYRQPDAAYGARKVLTMTHVAGYGLFAAIVLLYGRTGSTLWTDPHVQGALSTGLFLLILISAVAKSVQFPLHTWIPDAMAAPTPVSALLHAACYVKAGVYLVARLHSLGPWPVSWGLTVSWLGVGTLLVGVLFMIVQHDLKRLLAFSTVSQIGYMMLGLGLGTPLGIAAGLFHCLNHGLFKGSLFLCAGAVQHACGTRDMDQLGGLGRKMPRTMAIWLVATAGVAGIPLFNGFVSKWLLYTAALEARQPILALVPWIGSILTVFAFLKATSGVFLGSEGAASERAHEVSWTMVGGGSILAAGCVIFGVMPQLAVTYLINPLLPALGCTQLVGVGWLGITLAQGEWFATGGLVLSLVALGFAALFYWFPVPGRGLATAGGPPTVFTGGEPLSPQAHLGASDFSRIVKNGLAPFYRNFDVDRIWLALWHALGRLASRFASLVRDVEDSIVPFLAAAGALLALLVTIMRTGVGGGPASVPPLVPLAAATGISLLGLLTACAACTALRRYIVPLAVAGALACGGMLAPATVTRTLLLEGAAAVALLVLWRTSSRAIAWRGYLAALVLSAIGMVGGVLAFEHGYPQLGRALLMPGIAIKLGLFPLCFWLPLIAEWAPAVVAGLVIGVVDVAALSEVITMRGAQPGLFDPPVPWLALGLSSAIFGALLALAQRNLKRLLAFSTITDMGLLVTAIVLGGAYGIKGATLGAAAHAMAKALLFASVSGPEADGAALADARGLASRHPLAALGFVAGALAVLGVPPTLGYAAHWRIFSAVAGNVPLFVGLAAPAMLSIMIYARAIALYWWGAEKSPAPQPLHQYNPSVLGFAVVLLTLALLVAGLWPRLLGGAA